MWQTGWRLGMFKCLWANQSHFLHFWFQFNPKLVVFNLPHLEALWLFGEVQQCVCALNPLTSCEIIVLLNSCRNHGVLSCKPIARQFVHKLTKANQQHVVVWLDWSMMHCWASCKTSESSMLHWMSSSIKCHAKGKWNLFNSAIGEQKHVKVKQRKSLFLQKLWQWNQWNCRTPRSVDHHGFALHQKHWFLSSCMMFNSKQSVTKCAWSTWMTVAMPKLWALFCVETPTASCLLKLKQHRILHGQPFNWGWSTQRLLLHKQMHFALWRHSTTFGLMWKQRREHCTDICSFPNHLMEHSHVVIPLVPFMNCVEQFSLSLFGFATRSVVWDRIPAAQGTHPTRNPMQTDGTCSERFVLPATNLTGTLNGEAPIIPHSARAAV